MLFVISKIVCEQMVGLEPGKPGEEDGAGISQPRLPDGQAEAQVRQGRGFREERPEEGA